MRIEGPLVPLKYNFPQILELGAGATSSFNFVCAFDLRDTKHVNLSNSLDHKNGRFKFITNFFFSMKGGGVKEGEIEGGYWEGGGDKHSDTVLIGNCK